VNRFSDFLAEIKRPYHYFLLDCLLVIMPMRRRDNRGKKRFSGIIHCRKKQRPQAAIAVVAYNSGLPATTIIMSNASPAVVTESAYLTLHYRLAGADGTDIVTTFGTNPATLMLGQGQLAPFLEDRLLGMAEGEHKTFTLSAADGCGAAPTTRRATWSTSPRRAAAALPACCAKCATMPPCSISTTRWPARTCTSK
jgi:hypothetical protein